MYRESYVPGGGVSDLACERRQADISVPGIECRTEEGDGYSWERISIKSDEGARSIGRPRGNYDTLTLPRMDTLNEEEIDDAANEVAKELCIAMERLGVYPERLLVVGLGNRELTPDSIGPKAANAINATMHINGICDGYDPECSEIAVVTPGVTEQSGMESAELVCAICDRIEPDAVIAIDALASRSASRLGTTVQISDTGVFPGGGVGARRRALSYDTLGVPVIAIGVPTVINAQVIPDIAEESKARDFGSMLVSPREIDGITDAAADIIALGINQAFGVF